ncbi:Opacity protein [Azospirillum sp. RU38E]|nr:Opacity protein [Azospirillum sp. RU38E]SNT07956.1 Opacity protein [Azospirillum sp. RU37A]
MEGELHNSSIDPGNGIHTEQAFTSQTPAFPAAAFKRGYSMSHFSRPLLLAGLSLMIVAGAAEAQERPGSTGFYAVARGGGSITPKQKLDLDEISSSFPKDGKYKVGVTGQIGGGYDFGGIRLEQSAVYFSNDLKSSDFGKSGFRGDGRTRALGMSIAGYLDIPVTDMIVPYIGAGGGAARVETRLSGGNSLSRTNIEVDGKDWGLMWHVDAGVGLHLSPQLVLEVGTRYSQISGLKYAAAGTGFTGDFEPELSNLSGTVGIRYHF